jgi:hypothetical protein
MIVPRLGRAKQSTTHSNPHKQQHAWNTRFGGQSKPHGLCCDLKTSMTVEA